MPSNEQRRLAAKRKLERQLERRAVRAKRRRIVGVSVTVGVVVVVVGVIYYFATRPASSADPAAQSTTAPPSKPPIQIPTALAPPPVRPQALPATVKCEYPVEKDRQDPTKNAEPAKKVDFPPTDNISAKGTVPVTVKASFGELKLTLDRGLAPCGVNSFLSLVKQAYYDNTTCHRISTQGLQMLQCGDPKGTGSGGPGYTFNNETWPELKYGRGYLAMANAGTDKATGKGSNGSQFFLVYGNADGLSPDYTVLGTIDEAGLKAIDEVAKAGDDGSLDPQPGGGKPNKEAKLEKVTAAN